METRLVWKAGAAFGLTHFAVSSGGGYLLHGRLLSDYYLVHEGFWTSWALNAGSDPWPFAGLRLGISLAMGVLLGYMFRPVRYRFRGGPVGRGLVFSLGMAGLQGLATLWLSTVIDLPAMIWLAWMGETTVATLAGGAALGAVAGGRAVAAK